MKYRKLRIALIVVSGLILVAAGAVFAYVELNSSYYFPHAYESAFALLFNALLFGLPALLVFTITFGIHAVCEWQWRFSLRTLLIATTVVAVLLALIVVISR